MFASSLTTETSAEAVAALAPCLPETLLPEALAHVGASLTTAFCGTRTAPRPAH